MAYMVLFQLYMGKTMNSRDMETFFFFFVCKLYKHDFPLPVVIFAILTCIPWKQSAHVSISVSKEKVFPPASVLKLQFPYYISIFQLKEKNKFPVSHKNRN